MTEAIGRGLDPDSRLAFSCGSSSAATPVEPEQGRFDVKVQPFSMF
jgi:hypothetical protein